MKPAGAWALSVPLEQKSMGKECGQWTECAFSCTHGGGELCLPVSGFLGRWGARFRPGVGDATRAPRAVMQRAMAVLRKNSRRPFRRIYGAAPIDRIGGPLTFRRIHELEPQRVV